MNFVDGLSAQLKLDAKTAQAVAGGTLLLIEEFLKQRDPELAVLLRKNTPELSDWQTVTPTLPPGGLSLAAVKAANDERGQFLLLLTRFAIDSREEPIVLRLLLGFLAVRLGSAATERMFTVLPWLRD